MNIISLTNKIVKESNLKISTIAKKSGVNAGTIRCWNRECTSDALLSNVNAVLNQCGYCLAVVRKCEENYAETREQQRIS